MYILIFLYNYHHIQIISSKNHPNRKYNYIHLIFVDILLGRTIQQIGGFHCDMLAGLHI